MLNQKANIAVILLVIIILAVSSIGLYYLKYPPQEPGVQQDYTSSKTGEKIASSSAPLNNISERKTYQNQEYNFEFKYPVHYEELEMVEKDPNLNPYKTLVVAFKSNKKANTMAPESLYIYVTKPLIEYTYNNNQAGIAYKFDVPTKTWKSNSNVPDPTAEIQRLMPEQHNPENTIYKITYPCGGGKVIAIPPASDFVLELSVECMSSYPESEEEQKNMADINNIFNEVISSFKFTN